MDARTSDLNNTEPPGMPLNEQTGYRASDQGSQPSAETDRQAATADRDQDTAQIRHAIEQTRSDLGETIEAIGEKLSPRHIAEQAKETIQDATIGRVEDMMDTVSTTARSTSNAFLDTIRENPLPAVLAGIGLGWLFMKTRERVSQEQAYMRGQQYYGQPRGQMSYQPSYSTRTYGPTRPQTAGGRYYGTTAPGISGTRSYVEQRSTGGPGVTDRIQGAASNVAENVKDTASNVTDTVQDKVQQLGDQAQQFGGQAQETLGTWGDQTQYQMQRARSWFQQQLDDNPLAVAAAALAAGAVVGLAIPETQVEERWMGQARDQVVSQLSDVAQDTMQKVQSVATEASHAASQAAKQEAKEQGLMSSTESSGTNVPRTS